VSDPVIIGDATLYCGDCLEILPTLPKVDAVITDPPFGVGNFVQVTGRKMGRGESRGKSVTWNDSGPPPEFFEIVRSMSKHRIIWGANFFNCFEERGGAIVWDKAQSMPNFSKADIASCTNFQKTEVVRIPWTNFTVTHRAESDHPCERPVDLYEWCIKYLPQDMRLAVLDPYMGSGSCGVAAIHLGRKFIGIEIEPRYFDIACERIENAYRQGRLFEDAPTPKKQENMAIPLDDQEIQP
jgi:site-specific DNA-methyltransferase (adenine-specific)/modification methylase